MAKQQFLQSSVIKLFSLVFNYIRCIYSQYLKISATTIPGFNLNKMRCFVSMFSSKDCWYFLESGASDRTQMDSMWVRLLLWDPDHLRHSWWSCEAVALKKGGEEQEELHPGQTLSKTNPASCVCEAVEWSVSTLSFGTELNRAAGPLLCSTSLHGALFVWGWSVLAV